MRRNWATAGGGAAAVALVLLLAPAASAGNFATIHAHAPYKGAVQPYSNTNQQGCGFARLNQPWNFNLTSGSGGGSGSGKAAACKAGLYGLGQYSNSYVNGQVQVAITFKPPANTSHVQANVAASWSVAVKSSDGGHPSCNQGSTYDNTGYNAGWGWTKSQYGGYYANVNQSSWDRSTYTSGFITTTQWRNYTAAYTGVAPLPVPFHYNSTTQWSWYHNWGGSSNCYSSASVSGQVYSWLIDETNGSYIYQSASTLGGYYYGGQLFSIYVQTQNSSYWSCYNSTDWNGPSGSWYNQSANCYAYNTTVTSSYNIYTPSYKYGSSHNNSILLLNSSSVVGAWFWNYSFNHADRYAMFFTISGSGSASNSWPGVGQGTFLMNMATLGNGVKINSIAFS
ncbi:MAG TPA: hypothetical protein VFF67_00625 [Thermoplasmata archaeon]|nr:hypothetical protein [Thermoplasmata archaeon]